MKLALIKSIIRNKSFESDSSDSSDTDGDTASTVKFSFYYFISIFNRPGVAGPVLQTAS